MNGVRVDHPVNLLWRVSERDPHIIRCIRGDAAGEIVLRLYGHQGDMAALADHLVTIHNATLETR